MIKKILFLAVAVIAPLAIIHAQFTGSAPESVSIIRESCSGYSNCYTSLAAWESAQQRDLVAANQSAVARIEGTWSRADAGPLTISGWTTDATHYIKIYTAPEARHSGVWSSSAYRLSTDSGAGAVALNIANDHVLIEGLQIEVTGAYDASAIKIGAGGAHVRKNIIRNTATGTNTGIVFSTEGRGVGNAVYNNIIYGWDVAVMHSAEDVVSPIYNNTLVNNTTGFDGHWQGTLLLKNNLVKGSTNAFIDTFRTGSGYNVTNSAVATGGTGDAVNQVITFVNEAGGDFRLASSDTGARDRGITLSGDTYLALSDDIEGGARSGVWDAGADESSTSGSTTPVSSAPTLSFSASPTSVTSGGSTVLAWSTGNATSCSASGAWSGAKATSGSQTITNITSSGTYALSCTGAGGSTAQSVTVTVSATADTTAPTTPTSLSATAVSTSQINLSWNASTDVVGVVGYRIYRNGAQLTTTTGTTYSNTGLTAGTTYTYTVQAYDAAGNNSAQTAGVSATTQSITTAPTPITGTGRVLYVDGTNGNDSVTRANNSATSPWRSLGRAVWGSTNALSPNAGEAAQAGDTVIVRAGTYVGTRNADSRYVPLYRPVNNGTAANPITFRAEGIVNLRMNENFNGTDGIGQPILGAQRNSYIVWDGFTVDEQYINTTPDTGPIVVWDSDNITIQNFTIRQYGRWNLLDNHNGIRIEFSRNVLIRNNRIFGTNDMSAGMNATCLTAYDSSAVIIEHNECSDNETGFFVKGDHAGDNKPLHNFVIRRNYIHEVQNPIQFGGVGSTNENPNPITSYVYQNVVTNSTLGGVVFIGYDNTTPARVMVVNNTFNAIGASNNNEAGGILLRPGYTGYQALVFRNNIVTNSAAGVTSWDTAFNTNTSATTFSHNNYYGNGATAYVAYRNYNLNGWQTTFGKDTTGTLSVDPQYVNAAANDFHLQATSPVRAAGIDVLDLDGDGSTTDAIPMGAYVTGNEVIGITTGSTSTPTPTPTPTPTVTLSANPVSLTQGQSTTLTWSSTNATSCSASGAWSGTKATSGSQAVTPTTTSTYTLSCAGTGGTATQSTSVAVSAAVDTTAPTTPTNLSATAVSTSQINLGWNASTDNVGVTNYRLERCTGAACTTFTQIATPANVAHSDTNLTAGTTYRYRIRATDAAGNLSAYSMIVSATTQSATPASTKFTLNQRIQTTATLNIRSTADGTLLGSQASGTLGTIIGGPTYAGGYHWWNVNFDSGVDGWAAEDWMSVYTAPVVTQPTPITGTGRVLYVDGTNGNDSVTRANNSATNPWRTIGRAAWGNTNASSPNGSEAAQAGDTVIVRTGTYSAAGTNLRYVPAFNPANSGTFGNPITFQAEGAVRLSLDTGVGPVIGAYSRNYVTWRGFYINEATAPSTPDTGSVVLWDTIGSVVENLEIDGNGSDGRIDNHNGIRLEYATNVTVRNNRIHNVLTYASQAHHNAAGIMAYYSSGALIENNEIYDSGSGVFVKGGDNRDFTIRYNLLRNNAKGILFMYTNSSGQHRVYQNISRNNTYSGISIDLYSKNVLVANNTFVGNWNGVTFGNMSDTMANIMLRNNLVTNTQSEAVSGGEANTVAPFYLDNNNYYVQPGGWSIVGVRYTTISSWRNALGGSALGDEYSSTSVNPLYVNPAGNDFHLQSTSPVRTAGIDILDLDGDGSTTDAIPMGAYVTGNEVIGITSGTTVTPTPAPTLTLSASPAAITSGQNTTLTWSSTNATSCTASNGWSGTKTTSGSQVLTPTTNTTYTLTCTGSGGSATQGVTVTVTQAADTTSPTTPTGLTATTASSSQINLTWSASTDAVGVTGYRIYRNGIQITTTTGTTYANTGLTAATTYTYTVQAYDAAGNSSAQSAAVSATTQSVVVPIPTISLAALPTSIVAGQNTTLTWSSTNATSCTASNGWSGTKATSGSQVLTLTASSLYTLTCTGSGGSATQSVTVAVTQASDTTAPLITSATISNTTTTSARITVTTNEYTLATLRYGLSASILTNTATSAGVGTTHVFDLSNLTRKTTYAYQVTVTDAAGNTTTGPVSSFTTLSRLHKPPKSTNLTATAGSVILTWTNPDYEYIQTIRIYRRTNNGSVLNSPNDAYLIATLPAGTTTYRDTAVAPNTTYYYTIFTYDDQSVYSDPAEITFTTGADTVVTTPAPTPVSTTPTSTVTTSAPATGGGGTVVVATTPSTTPATTPSTQTPTTGTTTPPVTTTPSTTYPPLTRALGLGSKGDDVKTLQQMLAQDPTIYTEGDITGYYGPATQRAVERFQTKYAIVSSGSAATTGYGQVGPTTRTKLNALYAGTTQTTSGLTPEKRALIEAQIRMLQEQVKLLLEQLTLLLQKGAV